MQVLDNHYLKGVNYHKNTKPMHDLKSNFDKILPIVKNTLHDQLNTDRHLQFYPRKPTFCDARLISLALLGNPWHRQRTLAMEQIASGLPDKFSEFASS